MGNVVLGDMVRCADDCLLGKLYRLMELQGAVEGPLDLSTALENIEATVEANPLWHLGIARVSEEVILAVHGVYHQKETMS